MVVEVAEEEVVVVAYTGNVRKLQKNNANEALAAQHAPSQTFRGPMEKQITPTKR